MQPIFTTSTYDTAAHTPRFFFDKIFLNSRWYFVWCYFKEILRSRSLALKGQYNREEWAKSSYRIFKSIEGCGGRFHLQGLENLSALPGPVVFISNHMSTLETFAFPCLIAPQVPVTFVVKESLVLHPIFGPVMRAREPIVVRRVNPREDFQTVMTEGKKVLANGTSVIIFPQSTRSVKFIPEEFNSLGVKLAKSAGVPVLPVAIKTDFWGNGKYFKDIGPVDRNKPIHMKFGKPFLISGAGKDEQQQIVDFITENLQKWEREDA